MMRTLNLFLFFLSFLGSFEMTKAQDIFSPPALKPSVSATKISDVISVDGILNENEWKASDSLTGFTQIEPYQGKPSDNRTVVKLLYTEKYLYVGVYCYDTIGGAAIRAQDLQRDFNWRAHDTFAICIDGFNDERNSVTFATNPYGAQKDYLSFDDVLFDSDWNGLWKVRTTITDKGWFAEFQIPWKSMRYSKLSNESGFWGINFLRLRRASNEISAWSPYPRSIGFNRMEYAGVVQQIQPPPPSTNIQINPYSLLSINKSEKPDGTISQTHGYKLGGDMKWAVNSNTIADLTINTDFAQADADVQVNNVSRFSVLFPEKRQFFLENASLFGPGLFAGDNTGGSMQILPFFSRRIGLSDNGNPLPIDGGVRLVNRSVKQNFGVMAVHQRAMDTFPSSYSFVGRYSRNFGKQNRIGMINTIKSTAAGQSNFVGGTDGFIRFNAEQSLNFMALGSSNSNSTGQGFGGYAQYYYTNNKVIAWLTETVLTKDFIPELGFISRKDVMGTTFGAVTNFRGKYLPFKKYIRSYQPSIMTSWFHQTSTTYLTEREIQIAPFRIEMQDGGYYRFTVSDNYQNLTSNFYPLGITIDAGQYNYRRYSITSGSDPSRKISYTFQYDFGKYYNGALETVTLSTLFIPIPHVSLKASAQANTFSGVGSSSETKQVSLYTVQGRLALNPRIQLTGLYQRNSLNLNSYNIRFGWEYKPLSYIYLVINSRETMATERLTEQQGIVKISYLKQF